MGIAPPLAREGDIVCVLLGCHTPMVLRPHGENVFRIVGECCYTLGISEGEEILGPLPTHVRRVYASSREWGVHSCWEHVKTWERSLIDPRLEALFPSVSPDFHRNLREDPHFKLKLPIESLQNLCPNLRKFDIV